MVIVLSEFCHDLGHAPHHSDVAAGNAEHRSGRMINQAMNQASSSGLMNMSNCQCIQPYSAVSL